ncbi:MAG: restriction endonuclease subunit S [Thermoguttaceae bacterium]|nr:restriction endonuclease subunit S [Thermoguttaceae bacterium]
MALTFNQLGKYLRLVDERNVDLVSETVLGINIDKYFMPSVANIVGTDLGNYKLLRKGRFACNPMHVGRDGRLPIAQYTEEVPALVSPAYFMFEIIDENDVDPEFLMLYFRHPDFDRMCWFKTDASVRGGISWEDLCSLTVPVPPLPEQRKIVWEYRVIADRIELLRRINANIEAQAQTFFHFLFIDTEAYDCTLADISNINPSRSLKKNDMAMCYEMSTLPVEGCTPSKGEMKPYNGGSRFQNGDSLLARITPCFENGKAAYINTLSDGEIAFGSTEYIVFSSKDDIPAPFYYFLIRDKKFKNFGMQFMNGSSGRQRISGEEIGSFPMKRPAQDALRRFARFSEKAMAAMRDNSIEISTLLRLKNAIQTGITLWERVR